MGIRFKCHACGHELHVKDFLAGKRSKCPACDIRFRIPLESAEFSNPLTEQTVSDESSGMNSVVATATKNSAASVASPQTVTTSTAQPATVSEKPTTGPTSKSVPLAIQEAPEAAWFVQPPTGGQFGPAPATVFVEWLGENRITRDSMVWREGWPEWRLASDVFADYFPPPVAPLPTNVPSGMQASPTKNLSPTNSTAAVAAADKSELDAATSALTTVERTRLAKKLKRRRNYTLMILLLGLVAIGLVVALVVVLMRK